jgi:hypothetical protein
MDTPVTTALNETGSAFEIQLPPAISFEEGKALLARHINDLILHRFEYLVHILYRLDVSEIKLKQLLQSYPGEDAGLLIAELIIERQLQKIKTRQQSKPPRNTASDEEIW